MYPWWITRWCGWCGSTSAPLRRGGVEAERLIREVAERPGGNAGDVRRPARCARRSASGARHHGNAGGWSDAVASARNKRSPASPRCRPHRAAVSTASPAAGTSRCSKCPPGRSCFAQTAQFGLPRAFGTLELFHVAAESAHVGCRRAVGTCDVPRTAGLPCSDRARSGRRRAARSASSGTAGPSRLGLGRDAAGE